jgi:hypothetical protein
MPSPHARRVRSLGIAVVLFILVALYVTSAARQTRSSDFYVKTAQALKDKKLAADAALHAAGIATSANADVAKRLKEAEDKAKQAAHAKAEPYKEELMQAHKEVKEETSRLEAEKAAERIAEKGKSSTPAVAEKDEVKTVAGRKYMKSSEAVAPPKAGIQKSSEEDAPKSTPASTLESQKAEAELNEILKRSPSTSLRSLYLAVAQD